MKSARYKRMLLRAITHEQVGDFHRERSFGAKKFAKTKTRRKIAKASKKVNR